MQDRAIAMARCDLPVPVPPIRTALRCSARKPPVARSRTRLSLIGVSAKVKPSRSLASGNLTMVIWYLIERAAGYDLATDTVNRRSNFIAARLNWTQTDSDNCRSLDMWVQAIGGHSPHGYLLQNPGV